MHQSSWPVFCSQSFGFQRVTQICKLLGKSDETIQRKLQGFLSMESLDGFLAGHIDELTLKIAEANHNDIESKDADLSGNHVKSDSESGFDESSSQMSRSGIEDGYAMDSSLLHRSPSSETLSLDQLLMELKTVAVEWRSFRNVHNCSCATPFDHYVKKARLILLFTQLEPKLNNTCNLLKWWLRIFRTLTLNNCPCTNYVTVFSSFCVK